MMKKTASLSYFLGFLLWIVLSFSCEKRVSNDVEFQKILLRQIGNELLLLSNDSTSLILPVKNRDESKFIISFEKSLEIHPDTLVAIVKRNFKNLNNYRVQVLQCVDNEVAYSFEINAAVEKTIIPCSGRLLPKGCYFIEFDFLKNPNSKGENKLIFLFILLLLLLIVIIFFYRKKVISKFSKPIYQNHILLGAFLFYPEQNKLVKKSEEISLSKKECELLEIFVNNKNEVVKREELTKKVWEDNGVIVGRSLDTYISKLRKKIKADKNLQLINVHGIGYKLEIKE